MAPSTALAAARQLIGRAMKDPVAAAGLLDRAARHIESALASVGPETPADVARAVTTAAEELFAIMGCFGEEAT
jgi:hypothetical protein